MVDKIITQQIQILLNQFNAKNYYKLCTSGKADIIANSCMNLYGSIIKAVTDGCALKDSKNNLQRIQSENQG